MKIVIAGGTGFIGQEIIKFFSKQNHQIVVLGRSSKPSLHNEQYIQWDGKTVSSWKNELRNTNVLINLTGKSVDCRYTSKNKKEIFDSRTNAIEILEKAYTQINESPSVWINSSTATIYRDETESSNDEYSTRIGSGFSVEVAKKWEKTLDSITLKTRKVKLRIAIVLGNSGGAFPAYNTMAKYGAGGKHGNGEQMFSWIHIEDLCRVIDLVMNNNQLEGIINCSAPNPISNKVFMKKLRHSLKTPFGIPSPKWLLKIGTFILRTETELLLKSRWVISKRLEEFEFKFKYKTIDEALKALKNDN